MTEQPLQVPAMGKDLPFAWGRRTGAWGQLRTGTRDLADQGGAACHGDQVVWLIGAGGTRGSGGSGGGLVVS